LIDILELLGEILLRKPWKNRDMVISCLIIRGVSSYVRKKVGFFCPVGHFITAEKIMLNSVLEYLASQSFLNI